jgi:hypothetical protein
VWRQRQAQEHEGVRVLRQIRRVDSLDALLQRAAVDEALCADNMDMLSHICVRAGHLIRNGNGKKNILRVHYREISEKATLQCERQDHTLLMKKINVPFFTL